MRRRDFLYISGSAALVSACGDSAPKISGLTLLPDGTLGSLQTESGAAPIAGATWYTATETGDGLTYTFPVGALEQAPYLTADFLQDGNHKIVYMLTLREGENGPAFKFRFSGLCQCSYRMRLPLSLVDQNHWGIDREGAFHKPRVSGDRVDLAKVDRMTIVVERKSPQPARWCMTDIIAADGEVPLITKPLLPKGPLLDELGQSTIHEWPAKSRSVEEATARIRKQYDTAAQQAWPDNFSRWGGWMGKRVTDGAGYFRTLNEGGRWWLVDPDGYAFWSAGADCVRVDTYANFQQLESALTWLPDADGEYADALDLNPDARTGKFVNYLAANMIRALGSDGWRQKWADISLGIMKQLRFNTVGNWSEWEFAKSAQFPYTRPMSFEGKRIGWVYRDFPDVFDPNFEQDAADYASVLTDTRHDPAFLGYFLMNEPTWGFSSELPAEGMLYVTPECHTRTALAEWLRKKYANDAALAAAWKIDASFARVSSGAWQGRLSDEARNDLREFSSLMATRYFNGLSEACKNAAPNQLNLGMRWAGVPPMWAVEGMKSFDVFSMNCYRERVPRDVTDQIHAMLDMPVIIGEWHFGALDVGLPSSGIGHLKNQVDRAKAYRVYIEDAAANPNCVGTHWFTLYDESALGRFDGEDYNIGFLDVCNRPYEELSAGAIASHERIYEVAAGKTAPYDDVPEYLPLLY